MSRPEFTPRGTPGRFNDAVPRGLVMPAPLPPTKAPRHAADVTGFYAPACPTEVAR